MSAAAGQSGHAAVVRRAAALRRAVRQRQPVFGTWTSIGHPQITEMLTATGAEFVGIDIEHSTISLEQSQRIIAAAQAGGSACLPRLAWHDGEQIKRLADSGADGFIVPNVQTMDEVERLVAWMKYPPVGRRSYGVARAQGYGQTFADYTRGWNERSTLIIQIESIEGVRNVDRLLAAAAVDGVMVGPYDISGSLGIPGQLEHPRVVEACARVLEACRRAGKGCGTQLVEPDADRVGQALARGYTFVILASDIFLLWTWGARMRGLIEASRSSSSRASAEACRPRHGHRTRA